MPKRDFLHRLVVVVVVMLLLLFIELFYQRQNLWQCSRFLLSVPRWGCIVKSYWKKKKTRHQRRCGDGGGDDQLSWPGTDTSIKWPLPPHSFDVWCDVISAGNRINNKFQFCAFSHFVCSSTRYFSALNSNTHNYCRRREWEKCEFSGYFFCNLWVLFENFATLIWFWFFHILFLCGGNFHILVFLHTHKNPQREERERECACVCVRDFYRFRPINFNEYVLIEFSSFVSALKCVLRTCASPLTLTPHLPSNGESNWHFRRRETKTYTK